MWSFLVRVDIDRNSSKKCAEVQGPPRKGSKIVVSLFETLMFLSFISLHPMVMWCLSAVLLFQSIFLSTSFIHSYSNLWSPLLYERAQPSFKFVHKKHLTWYWCTPLTGFVLLARLSSQRHRCTLLVLSHCILSALHKVLVVGNIGCHRRKTCFHIFSTKCIVARLLSLAHCSWSALTTLCIVPGSTFSPSGHFRQLQHLRACWRGSGKPEHCWKCQLRSDKFNGLQTEMPVEPKAGGQIQENIRDLTFVGLFWIELRKSRQPRRQRSCQPPIVLGPLPVRGGAP